MSDRNPFYSIPKSLIESSGAIDMLAPKDWPRRVVDLDDLKVWIGEAEQLMGGSTTGGSTIARDRQRSPQPADPHGVNVWGTLTTTFELPPAMVREIALMQVAFQDQMAALYAQAFMRACYDGDDHEQTNYAAAMLDDLFDRLRGAHRPQGPSRLGELRGSSCLSQPKQRYWCGCANCTPNG